MKKFLFALLLSALLLNSCESSVEKDLSQVEIKEPTAEQIALFSQYSLIRPDVCDKSVTDAALSIRNKLGLSSITTDWVNRDEEVPNGNVEILVGDTNRTASIDALKVLTDYRGNYMNDFVIQMKDSKLVIVGGSADATSRAAEFFLTRVLPNIDASDLENFEYVSRREYEAEMINGVSAGEYAIYIPREASEDIKAYANELKALVAEKSGFDIQICTKESDRSGGIYICTEYGEGKNVTDELKAYRENCNNDWALRVDGSKIVAAGCSEESALSAFEKLKEYTDSLFGGENNNDFIYRKDYKMITLNGKNIREYSILLGKDATVDMINAAKKLAAAVLEQTGFEIAIVDEATENNIRIEIAGELDEGKIGFDGNDLVISGGHYVSASGAATEFISSLTDNKDYKSDYTLSKKFDTVPLVSERYSEMTLVWNDEFDSEGDELYDHSKWVQRDQMVHSDMYNSETERNVKSENGELILRSWAEEDTSISNGKPYSTNRSMTTYDSCNFTYGYLEMRAKVPFGKGCWPSFWTNQRTDMRAEGQDWMSEIDIFEVFGSKDSLVPNIHKWYGADKEHYHVQLGGDRKTSYKFTDLENLSNEYHTYGFYWDEEKMVFSVDGEDYCTIDITPETGDFGTYAGMEGFHTPNYIIINNFLFTPAGSWIPEGAEVDDSMEYPVTYTIDYIRLYQGENGEMYAPNLGQTYEPKKAAE